jgi:ribosomal protein L5|tara:strand:+ start:130 stop:678 length:549 start_codon:yes stop_codon:yes gene_type:complete
MTLYSQNFKKQNKLSRNFVYENIHEIPFTIEKLTLFYTLKKDISLKSLIKFSSLLELVTGQRAYFIRSKKSSVFLKIRKGAPCGVKVTLRKKSLIFFLLTLIWKIIPNIKNFRKKTGFSKIKNQNFNALMLLVPDPLLFSELKAFYFFFKTCVNLRILISFSKKTKKKELYFNCRFSQLPLL